MRTLEPIHKFSGAAVLLLWLAGLGKDHPRYTCPFCHIETEHAQRQGERSGELFAICLVCGQGSRVRPAAPAEFRPDGWPLCPICGEDELWSPLIPNPIDSKPPISAYIAAGLSCYRCQWSNDARAVREGE